MEKVVEFLKKNWWLVLGFIFAYPLITAYMRSQEAKDKVRASQDELKQLEIITSNPSLLSDALNEITTNKTIQTVALEVYHHLGYKYSWYDPRRWTENDKKIYELLSQFSYIPVELTDCYFIVSQGRSLRDDLIKVLDEKYYKLLVW